MVSQQHENGSQENAGHRENRTNRVYRSAGRFYQIRVRGHLDRGWSEWLEGLEMQLLDNGETVLLGSVVDQAALMGILNRLSHLNLTLLAVNEVERKD